MTACPSSPTLSSLPLAFPGLSIHSPPPSNPGDPITPSALGPDPDHPQQASISSYFDSTTTPAVQPQPQPQPAILRLPQELIELVGLGLCRLRPSGPPTELVNLLLTCKRFNRMLGKGNDGFYADLFRERFDYLSVCRRWQSMKAIEDRREKKALLAAVTELRPDEDLKFEALGSFTRPTSPESFSPASTSIWRPLTSHDLAIEFKRRCVVLTKMRTAAKQGHIPPTSSRPSSPRLQAQQLFGMSPTEAGKTKLRVPEPDELTQNMWTCYLMLLENDGRNLRHLVEYACLRAYMKLFYKQALLNEAMSPGWPRQTAGRALGLWIGWLGGDDLTSEDEEESDQRFFVLKPYVFGAHKFDAFYAPWSIPSLPISHKDYPVAPPPRGMFEADLRPRSQAQLVTHMGRKIPLAPPILSHAAIFSFFFRVEQDDLAGDGQQGHDPTARPPPTLGHAPAPATPATATGSTGVQAIGTAGPSGAILTAASKPAKTSLPVLASRVHDRDFARLSACIDPYSSLGLPALYTRGDLAGSWEGRFSFFDFDSYRDMLGGRMRSLYEGPFGDQPQVWKIEERVVRLRKGERAGGRGPVLNAGFEVGQGVPPASEGVGRRGGEGWVGIRGRSESGSGGGGAGVDGEDDRANKRPRSLCGEGPGSIWDEGVDEDQDGDYEILLTGSGHSAWGQFVLKGRVRAYDGLFSIIKEYTPDSRGRWTYRGYCIGGNLVGRWRDTHTPVDMSGYEGTFLMSRRGG